MTMRTRFGVLFGLVAAVLGLAGLGFGDFGLSGQALAAEPQQWHMDFQPAATPVMERVQDFHDLLMVVITAITIFVMVLLGYVMWRFSEKRNANPSRTTHHTLIEVIWTVVPVLILVVIAVPSFRLLYYSEQVENAEMTIKATGRQWYWSYDYPDHGDFTFDATMIPEADLKPGQKRLLETDNVVVLPVDTTVRILITASDVLHSFAVPAFGIKKDAVPGRMNETWLRIEPEYAGTTFYGQCSEICGTGHSFMPIAIKAVTKAEFAAWVEQAKVEFADGSDALPVERNSDTLLADASARAQ
ncbi:cytochrome c oxidase subunit II [Limibacillus halophilus]|uniref:Cytochrome c oxidase subunit 2 n=1 Tax=Limibacillus halophilus TaxID=1579333 RepID=A0A839SWL7_9PROT|nr:cytochrome c oxidase subunit II [Limibacillus halophilus]MBB3066698.1 cytochrome c oxidase subunit 2 [Limibacillus halophilus]